MAADREEYKGYSLTPSQSGDAWTVRIEHMRHGPIQSELPEAESRDSALRLARLEVDRLVLGTP